MIIYIEVIPERNGMTNTKLRVGGRVSVSLKYTQSDEKNEISGSHGRDLEQHNLLDVTVCSHIEYYI